MLYLSRSHFQKNIPFELHITIKGLETSKEPDFLAFCTAHHAKPILIELLRGNFIDQPMFTKVVYAQDMQGVFDQAASYKRLLNEHQFEVQRLKIEVPAQHHALFTEVKERVGMYFEWHCKIKLINKPKLLEICSRHEVHLSLNALRKEQDIRFITLREYHSKERYDKRITDLKKDLQETGVHILKEQSEFCIYDSNKSLDEGWLHNN